MNAHRRFSDSELQAFGYVAWRLAGDVWLGVLPMTYGKGRLCSDLHDYGYEDGWCYESVAQAIVAMHEWDPQQAPEPTGWFRHPLSGRRRPGGDPSKEHVAP